MDHYVNISICVDNAAFGDTYNEQAHEVARILRLAADRIQGQPGYLNPTSGVTLCLNDVNGNRVGTITPGILPIS